MPSAPSMSSTDSITEPDKVIAHFLFKLLQFYEGARDLDSRSDSRIDRLVRHRPIELVPGFRRSAQLADVH